LFPLWPFYSFPSLAVSWARVSGILFPPPVLIGRAPSSTLFFDSYARFFLGTLRVYFMMISRSLLSGTSYHIVFFPPFFLFCVSPPPTSSSCDPFSSVYLPKLPALAPPDLAFVDHFFFIFRFGDLSPPLAARLPFYCAPVPGHVPSFFSRRWIPLLLFLRVTYRARSEPVFFLRDICFLHPFSLVAGCAPCSRSFSFSSRKPLFALTPWFDALS